MDEKNQSSHGNLSFTTACGRHTANSRYASVAQRSGEMPHKWLRGKGYKIVNTKRGNT